MRRKASLFSVFALILSVSAVAHADKFYFTVSGSGHTGNGLLFGSADPTTPNAFDITSATGTIDHLSIGIAPGSTATSAGYVTDPSGQFFVDNVIYLNGSHGNLGGDYASPLDNGGLLFVNTSNTLFNIYSGGGDQFISSPGTYPNADGVTFTIATTPEPSSFALLGTGLLGAAGFVRRRFSGK